MMTWYANKDDDRIWNDDDKMMGTHQKHRKNWGVLHFKYVASTEYIVIYNTTCPLQSQKLSKKWDLTWNSG